MTLLAPDIAAPRRLLVVDDEEGPRQSLNMIFSDEYDVTVATSGEDAIKLAKDQSFDVVITDIRMRGLSGIDVLREIKSLNKYTEVVILTAYETLDTARQAISLGASEYLKKPFDLDHIKKVVDRCYENYLNASQTEVILKKELNAAKRNFLEIVSHELNTPVNGILGFIDLLNETELDEEQKQYVETIRDCSIKCFEHFQDIQTYAKVTMSETEISCTSFNPSTLVLQVVSKMSRTSDIVIHTDLSNHLPEYVSGPEHEIRLVLSKIIQNAVKFTRHGDVHIRLNSQLKADNNCILTFEVIDSGPGIDPKSLASGKIYDAFTQADSSLTRPHEGLGLGLALCKTLVDRMDGTLKADSELGKGARFEFTVEVSVRDN